MTQPEASSQPYTVDEVVHTFAVLLDSLDFSRELELLGIGRLHFVRRRRFLAEFNALAVGLWRLALERSFPNDHESIFNAFVHAIEQQSKDVRKTAHYLELVRTYLDLLATRREHDFTVVGAHIVDLLGVDGKKAVALRLHLALQIRKLYSLIFDNLI